MEQFEQAYVNLEEATMEDRPEVVETALRRYLVFRTAVESGSGVSDVVSKVSGI